MDISFPSPLPFIMFSSMTFPHCKSDPDLHSTPETVSFVVSHNVFLVIW